MAAKPPGEQKRSARGRGFSPARAATVLALAIVVVVLAVVLFSGGGGHKYTFVFENAGQLVPDNQVLIGGSPVGTVEEIGLTDDNLAAVEVSVSQELHEGTTAVIRATSLSGVANHYVSISPGPNSSPALDNGAELGLSSTTTPVDIDQLFNTFPPSVLKGLQNFIKGNSQIYAGRGPEANESYKYFGTALNRASALASELNADERLLSRFVVSSGRFTTAVAGKGAQLSNAVHNANQAFRAIADQNVALGNSLRELPPVLRQSNTTFVNLRAALDDVEPLVDVAKPATRELAPFLAEFRPVLQKFIPFTRNLRKALVLPGRDNDTNELLAILPSLEGQTSRTFPHAIKGIQDFQPQLNFLRSYTPELYNAIGKFGQVTGYYDGNGHYARVATSLQNLFRDEGGTLKPITTGEQFNGVPEANGAPRPCPGGAAQPPADGSTPFTNPPYSGSGAPEGSCDPNDVPPGS